MATSSVNPANSSATLGGHGAGKNLTFHVSSDSVVCYAPTMITANGFWEGVNPLEYAMPIFILQLVLVVATTRLLVVLLRPLRQPRVVSEIIGGIVLGPSVLGHVKGFAATMFPSRSILTLETVAHLGLLFFLFLIGVEIDASALRRVGRRPFIIAAAGMALPFSIGCGASFAFRHQISHNIHQVSFLLFLGVALSVTAFPVLARILAETKLLNTELGQTAMSAAVVNDMCAWILLALAIALSDDHATPLSSLWILLAGAAFVLVCFFAVRPAMSWLGKRTAEADETITDSQLCGLLVGVMLAALATDSIGIHSVSGAFVFGLVMPTGAMGASVIEKMEDFVTGILLPLFFVISGLKTDVSTIRHPATAGLLFFVFVLASVAKIAGTLLVSIFYAMPLREGLSLGFLMNTRGLVEMIILNIGRDKKVLDEESFSTMVLVSTAVTALVTPAVNALQRPSQRLIGYRRRTLQLSKPDAELRMLAGLHDHRHVSPILSLLSLSNPNKRAPIFLYALHLFELTGRSSALIAAAPAAPAAPNFISDDHAPAGVSVYPLTAVSPYDSMHVDVCRLAEEKRAAVILLPFHKHLTVDRDMEPEKPGIRNLNVNVLASAPCSVALLVDRGLSAVDTRSAHHVALLFFGGPHDREALAFAWRMADNPSTTVAVLRFLPVADQRFYDLCVVGKAHRGAAAALTAGMAEWAECPELGPIGDLLASSDFSATVSVLVVQQYVDGEAGRSPETPGPRQLGGNSSLRERISNFNIVWGGR
ncbi:Cation/H(+) antiporter 15 [Apostasia shenzhenica]|uniref:Cation/H(+) antiporter 15 n=1 Tax=Apostasia shenzhenica TaxID=1088818 RepID=A0A2I0A8H0_9ASPA|nr:Cation/H(+) antiporter 15 [Apostasia shenzhenica]